MSWQVLIGISVVTYSFSTLLQKVLLKEEGTNPISFSIAFQALVGIIITLLGIALSGYKSVGDATVVLGNLVASVVLYLFFNIVIYKALKVMEASKFTIVFSTRALFTILASTLSLGEALSKQQLAGTSLILGAVILVNLSKTRLTFGRGELLALLAAFIVGLANTNDRTILMHVNLYPYMTYAFLVPAFALSVIYPKEAVKIKAFLNRKTFVKLVFLCAIFAVSSSTFFAALQSGSNSSQIAVINLTSIILIVLLSFVFLKETEGWLKKLAGAVLSFAGLLLLG